MMSNENENVNRECDKEDYSLLEILAVIWRWKLMIVIITALAAIGVLAYHIIALAMDPEKSYLSNRYTAEALILVDDSARTQAGVTSSLRGDNSLPGLGIQNSFAHSEYSDLAVFLVKTNTFLDVLSKKFNIIERYHIQKYPIETQRSILRKHIKVNYEPNGGILSIKFSNAEPDFSRDVANFIAAHLIERLDELIFNKDFADKIHLEENISRTFQEIKKLEDENQRLERSVASAGSSGRIPEIMMEMDRINMELSAKRLIFTHLRVQQELASIKSGERPVFQILEYADAPQKKSGPNRTKSCFFVTLAAFAAAVMLAFVCNFFSKIKNDPAALALFARNKKDAE